MNRRSLSAALLLQVLFSLCGTAQQTPVVTDTTRFVATYCVACHSDKGKEGGLTLSSFDAMHPERRVEIAEKIILKLRAGTMPPPGVKRPERAAAVEFVRLLESGIDAAAAPHPDPGWRPFQRLNRVEYARAIRDLLGVTLDAAALLPPDSVSDGFDNVADVQSFSATLLTGYLRGAGQAARFALSDPAARRKLLTCHPRTPAQELPCATAIIERLTTQAYRGTATTDDRRDALEFFRRGRAERTFDDGIRLAVQSILMSPRFLFRLESASAEPGVHPVSEQVLASRLSYFLWGAAPDRELLATGALKTPAAIEKQVRRLLADKRSENLANRFAGQWLRLQDLEKIQPDHTLFPAYDASLAAAMRRETELLFNSIVREDRSVLDLLTSDYSFLNEPLAVHYGIPNVRGGAFRRVAVPEERRGILGQGSILASTSVADRTSAVLRGKWILEVLLGTPPSPPPPNVPALDDSVKAVRGGTRLSTRQRIEQHRKNPSCNSCHRYIDPLGLALENFDVTGAWRTSDNGVAVDAGADLPDGTKLDGLAGLRRTLLDHQDLVLRTFTKNLLTYAIGRRVEATDMPAVRAIVNRATARGNRLSEFVLGVVESPAFRMTRTPAGIVPPAGTARAR